MYAYATNYHSSNQSIQEQELALFKADRRCMQEHPSVRGYSLEPAYADCDAAEISPM
jgi:hypothetical protein